jgi:hypothetical protein
MMKVEGYFTGFLWAIRRFARYGIRPAMILPSKLSNKGDV